MGPLESLITAYFTPRVITFLILGYVGLIFLKLTLLWSVTVINIVIQAISPRFSKSTAPTQQTQQEQHRPTHREVLQQQHQEDDSANTIDTTVVNSPLSLTTSYHEGIAGEPLQTSKQTPKQPTVHVPKPKYKITRFVMPTAATLTTEVKPQLIHLPALQSTNVFKRELLEQHQAWAKRVESYGSELDTQPHLAAFHHTLTQHINKTNSTSLSLSRSSSSSSSSSSISTPGHTYSHSHPHHSHYPTQPQLSIVLVANDILFPHKRQQLVPPSTTTTTTMTATSPTTITSTDFTQPINPTTLSTLRTLCQPRKLNSELFLMFHCVDQQEENELVATLNKTKHFVGNIVRPSHIVICQQYETISSYIRHLLPNVVITTSQSTLSALNRGMIPWIFMIGGQSTALQLHNNTTNDHTNCKDIIHDVIHLTTFNQLSYKH